jgi:hypothetical protein
MAMPPNNTNYALMRESNPTWFVQLGTMDNTRWLIYGVSALSPTGAACEEAARATSH